MTERGERFLLRVKDFKDCCQLGNLQHIAQTLAQTGELDIGSGFARGRKDPY
jgi:hypothetical protein